MENKSSTAFYNEIHSEKDHYGAATHYFSWAGNFHRYRIEIFKNIFKSVVKFNESTTILDVGCSKTVLGEVFGDKHPKIDAFDISSVAIEKVKSLYPYINFFVADAQEFKSPEKKDVVFAGEIIEHLPDPKKAFKNWADSLKSGGYMMMTTPNKIFNRKNEEHVSLLSIKDVKKMATDNGLKVLKIIGVDIFNDVFDPRISKLLNKVNSHLLWRIYSWILRKRMSLSYRFPNIATNVIYVLKKN